MASQEENTEQEQIQQPELAGNSPKYLKEERFVSTFYIILNGAHMASRTYLLLMIMCLPRALFSLFNLHGKLVQPRSLLLILDLWLENYICIYFIIITLIYIVILIYIIYVICQSLFQSQYCIFKQFNSNSLFHSHFI